MSAVELSFGSMKGGTGSGMGGFFNVVTPPFIRQAHELDLRVVCDPQSRSITAIAILLHTQIYQLPFSLGHPCLYIDIGWVLLYGGREG